MMKDTYTKKRDYFDDEVSIRSLDYDLVLVITAYEKDEMWSEFIKDGKQRWIPMTLFYMYKIIV